jgi:hypothetical protein
VATILRRIRWRALPGDRRFSTGLRRIRCRALPGVRRLRFSGRHFPWPPEALAIRDDYEHHLSEIAASGIETGPPMELQVFCLSAQERLAEQVACLRSFLAHVGVPDQFTVVSDGSHTRHGRDLLRAIHPSVTVENWRRFAGRSPRVVRDYARIDWRGQKVALLVAISCDQRVLYTDDDVLFFAAARELHDLTAERELRYLRDCDGPRPFLDPRMLRDPSEARNGVNSGFLFLGAPLDWEPALRRLESLSRRPHGFSGQTLVHLAMHGSGARPLDRARYVVADDDRTRLEDPHIGPDTVLRHYVGPVRHKFWLALGASGTARAARILSDYSVCGASGS